MVIGIISDTHGYFHPAIPKAFEQVDVILHAGDVGPGGLLDRLGEIAPTRAVYGNVDGPDVRARAKGQLLEVFDGIRFLMTHIGGHPKRWAPGIRDTLMRAQPGVFVCGHSHILRIERVRVLNNLLYLNPGAAGRQGFHTQKTCVRVVIDSGRLKTAQIVHLDE